MKKFFYKINPIVFLLTLVFLFGVYWAIWQDYSFLENIKFIKNLALINSFLFKLIPLFLFIVVITGFVANKWALKIEKVSLGGFNILFDNPVKLYKRSIRSFLETKRTLFNIDFERDNFDETLTSYYNTYDFFRNEMKILDSERKRGSRNNKEQQELYELTNKIIQVLNEFLSSHQNNFRRWYKYVSESNEVKRIDGEGVLEFHITPINEVQRHYYRYTEICKGFEEVNQFFNKEVKQKFNVNGKWERIEKDA